MTETHPADKAADEVLDEMAGGDGVSWDDLKYSVEEMQERWKQAGHYND